MKKFLGGLFIFLLANTLFVPESLADDACADPGLCTQPFEVRYKMAEYPVDSTVTSNHFTFCKTADDTVNWLEAENHGFIWFLNSKYNTSRKESYIKGETFTFYKPNDGSQNFPFAYRVNGQTYQPGSTMTLPEQTDGEPLYVELITNPQLTNGVKYLRCAEFSDLGVSTSDVPGFIFGYADDDASSKPTYIYITRYLGNYIYGFKEYGFNNFRFNAYDLSNTTTVSSNTFTSISAWWYMVLNVNPNRVLRGFLTWYTYITSLTDRFNMENVYNQYKVVDQDFDYTDIIVNTGGETYYDQVYIPFSAVNARQLDTTSTNIFTSAYNSGTVGELTFAYNHIKFHPLYATPCADDTVTSCDWDAPDKMICNLKFEQNGNVTYENGCCYGFEPTDK